MEPIVQVALISTIGLIVVALIGLLPRYLGSRKVAQKTVQADGRINESRDTFAWFDRLLDRAEDRADRAETRADRAEAELSKLRRRLGVEE